MRTLDFLRHISGCTIVTRGDWVYCFDGSTTIQVFSDFPEVGWSQVTAFEMSAPPTGLDDIQSAINFHLLEGAQKR